MSRQSNNAPIVWTLVSIALTATYFTIDGASFIADAAGSSELFAEATGLQDALVATQRFGDRLGLPRLRAVRGTIRRRVNEKYVVFEKETKTSTAGPNVAPPPPPPTGDPLAHQKAPKKFRVLVIGASSIQFAVGVEFEKRMPTYEGVSVKRFGQLATGLARPDFMNWPQKFDELATEFHPDLVITNFGGNGAQDIPLEGYEKAVYGTDAWDRAYGDRVKEMIAVARKHRADIVMLGMPNMRSGKFSRKMRRLNTVMKKAVEEEDGIFISTYEMASQKGGKYRKTLTYRGKRGLMRTSDGVHYTRLGARFIVSNVLEIVERHFIMQPPNKKLGLAERHTYQSKALGHRTGYVAYRPRKIDQTNKPTLVVVMPEDRSQWSGWPNHPHRLLQTAAEKHNLTVVLPDATVTSSTSEPFLGELLGDALRHLPMQEKSIRVEGPGVRDISLTAIPGARFSVAPLERKTLLERLAPPTAAAP